MTANTPQMTLTEHLQELRRRLLRSLVALLVGSIAGSFLAQPALALLTRPLAAYELIVLSPTEAPIVFFEVTLLLGVLLALPYILFEVYRFIAPALEPHERKPLLLGIPAFLALFALGDAFTLFVLIPLSLPVLQSFLGDIARPTYSLEQYLAFISTMLLWMGLLFQTPLVLYLLARLGIVRPATLRRLRKAIIFGAAVVAAVITPTHDPVTMLLVTGPFIVLYELGLLLARLAGRQKNAGR